MLTTDHVNSYIFFYRCKQSLAKKHNFFCCSVTLAHCLVNLCFLIALCKLCSFVLIQGWQLTGECGACSSEPQSIFGGYVKRQLYYKMSAIKSGFILPLTGKKVSYRRFKKGLSITVVLFSNANTNANYCICPHFEKLQCQIIRMFEVQRESISWCSTVKQCKLKSIQKSRKI